MSRHTEGPWTALWPKFDSVIVDTKERVIASVSFSDYVDAECEANTHLIAAAPELLAACKAFIDAPESASEYDTTYSKDEERALEAMRAAIAKAEGR